MLLRRIIDHFRKQEWTAIGIDFVIVVVGVFIGIQAANWNEVRAENKRAEDALERFRDDLNADLKNYALRKTYWTQVHDYGMTGLAYVERPDRSNANHWGAILAFFQSSQVGEFWTVSATFDELRSAGELDLIRDVELRNALSTYYVFSDNPVFTERPVYRENVRGRIPIAIQNYIWEECYTSHNDGSQDFVECSSPISDETAAAVAASLADDAVLMAQLRYWTSTMKVAQLISDNRISLANELLAMVEAEIAQ